MNDRLNYENVNWKCDKKRIMYISREMDVVRTGINDWRVRRLRISRFIWIRRFLLVVNKTEKHTREIKRFWPFQVDNCYRTITPDKRVRDSPMTELNDICIYDWKIFDISFDTGPFWMLTVLQQFENIKLENSGHPSDSPIAVTAGSSIRFDKPGCIRS